MTSMNRFFLVFLLFITACSTPPREKTSRVIFRFAGDVMFDRGIKRVLKSGVKPFRHILNLSTNADIMMVNLETTVATNGTKITKLFNFMSAPETLSILTNAGVDVVSIANNHTMDYGLPAIQQTRANLEKYRILYSGAGADYNQASQPVIITNNGIRIGFLAFGDIFPLNLYASDHHPGVAGVDPKRALPVVAALRPRVDILIVSLHWGWEYEDMPKSYQISIAHQYIDSGADLIIGHHPHVLQGVEKYRDGYIFYSMGNFIFDQKKELKTRYTMVGEFQISRVITPQGNTNFSKSILVYPFIKDYNDYMPRPLDQAESIAWRSHFTAISAPLGPVSLGPLDGSNYNTLAAFFPQTNSLLSNATPQLTLK